MTLPSDLERLGCQLEAATRRAVRRRTRRQRALNALAALAVTVPVALALSGDAAPPAGAPALAEPLVVYSPAPNDNVAVRRLQGERPPATRPAPACRCGRPAPPMRLVSYPDPARRA